jgi:hypothetical protein
MIKADAGRGDLDHDLVRTGITGVGKVEQLDPTTQLTHSSGTHHTFSSSL